MQKYLNMSDNFHTTVSKLAHIIKFTFPVGQRELISFLVGIILYQVYWGSSVALLLLLLYDSILL